MGMACATNPAFAAVDAVEENEVAAPEAPPVAPTDEPAGKDIIVSATKSGSTVQDTPVAISVTDNELIQDRNIGTITGLQTTQPNLRFALVTGTPILFIRGVGGGGRNVGFEPRVGVYVDGVYQGNTASLDSVMVGLDRVEVLRGPQGFLFGAASDAGAISLVTRAPSPNTEIEGSIGYGDRNRFEVTGYANTALTDNIYANIASSYRKRDGYILNVPDGKHLDDVNDFGVRSRVRIDASNDVTIDLAADYFHQKTHMLVGELLFAGYYGGPTDIPKYTSYHADPEFDEKSGGGASATVNYEGDSFNLTSITAYRTAKRQWVTDTDHIEPSIMLVDYRDRYTNFSQEITMTSADTTAAFRWLGGIYYSQMTADSNRTIFDGPDAALVPGRSPGGNNIVTPSNHARSYSAYVSLDYDVFPSLTLNVGARATSEQRILTMSQDGRTTSFVDASTFVGFEGKISDQYISPTIGLSWKPADDIMLYAKYAKGRKPAGFNADFITESDPDGLPYEVDAEKVDSYEAGLKSRLFGRAVTANVSAFLNDFTGYQVRARFASTEGTTTGGFTRLTSAGAVRTYGVEFDLSANPVEGLDLTLNGSRLWANYVEFKNGGGIGVDYDGNRLEYSPKWTVSAAANYTRDMDLFTGSFFRLGTNFYYRGSAYTNESNNPDWMVGSAKLLDARVGFGARDTGSFDWNLTFSVENILKEDALVNNSGDAGTGVRLGFREIPRRFFAKFSFAY